LGLHIIEEMAIELVTSSLSNTDKLVILSGASLFFRGAQSKNPEGAGHSSTA
jgi:hypothetical protein